MHCTWQILAHLVYVDTVSEDYTITRVNANKLPPLPRNYTSATHSSKVLSKINNIRMTAQLSDYIHG